MKYIKNVKKQIQSEIFNEPSTIGIVEYMHIAPEFIKVF